MRAEALGPFRASGRELWLGAAALVLALGGCSGSEPGAGDGSSPASSAGGASGTVEGAGGGIAGAVGGSGVETGAGASPQGAGGAESSAGGTTGASTGGQSSSGVGGHGGTGPNSGGSAGAGSGGFPPGSSFEIVGRRLLLNGEVFHLRGVNWNPVRKGGTHPADLDFAGFATQDIQLMQAAGFNAIRTYERLEDVRVLDALHDAGIYVFSTVYGWWQDDPSVVEARVLSVKDHPAILAWVLGNEWNYNQLYSDGQITIEQARDQINAAAALIQEIDPDHPVTTIYGELAGLADMVASMPDIDLWGINSYRGAEHGDLFSVYASQSDKPMFLGEYGADAYNATDNRIDLESQAYATRKLTEELIDNYAGIDGGTTLGGFVFEFADEWWKDGSGSPSAQDVGGIAPGGGPFPDQTFNEEFWGIVDIDRQPRPAYEELRTLYRPNP